MAGSIPNEIAAGITFSVSLSYPEYSAPEWGLTLILRGPQAITLDAARNGDEFTFSATADATAAWAPGTYWWQLRAVDTFETRLLEDGQVKVLQDLSAVEGPFDGRSHAVKVLEAVEAVIEGRATLDQQSYSINNRSLTRTPIADLIKLRAQYRAQVQAEKAGKKGGRLGRVMRVRFS
ncbi:hypothetical protein T8A63_15220 [Sulfitobacter sp. OXR-159]|uniref:hypothetical protein n=1 Tax=Sulfitobacter sp. OXR-159 TaxID=3100174 RepID=UPI002AC8FAEF|nr:hypothetical protein [Sulfitobacter sp. OXR-159]WPZ28964.1 hypothetical protein T8A63_15220 [Sulfitobacter sp. OXR-159]